MAGNALAIGEHPEKRGKVVLLFTRGEDTVVMAEFLSPDHALDVQDWLDSAFKAVASANQRLTEALDART